MPSVLEDLLDASYRLRASALHGAVPEGSTFRRRMCAFADLVERAAIVVVLGTVVLLSAAGIHALMSLTVTRRRT